ncbi:MAG: 30S ribosomal protein S17e [Candidatus Bathyarchaeales archaeon]
MEEPAYLGKVKTEHIKRLAKELMNRFPDKFSTNFEDNKRAVDALTHGATTRVRNQIAGYITHAMTLKQAVQLTETEEEIAA